MKVQEAMMGLQRIVRPETNLGAAIELLWNRNCGILPILDAQPAELGGRGNRSYSKTHL
jgi:hypothetical protein